MPAPGETAFEETRAAGEHEPLDALSMSKVEVESHLTAERIADEDYLVEFQFVQEALDVIGQLANRLESFRAMFARRIDWQLQCKETIMLLKTSNDGQPIGRTAEKSVQHDDGNLARSDIVVLE